MVFDYETHRALQRGADPDRGLLVSFEYKAEEKDGEYQNVPYIRIWMDKNTEVFRKVTEDDKRRFHDRWDAFERNEEAPPEGEPINMVPFATPANVAACKAEKVYTVEQLVETPDNRLQRAALLNFKYMCRDYLESKTRTNYIGEMRAEIERLNKTVALLTERLEAAGQTEEEPKPKRKYTRRKAKDGDSSGTGEQRSAGSQSS